MRGGRPPRVVGMIRPQRFPAHARRRATSPAAGSWPRGGTPACRIRRRTGRGGPPGMDSQRAEQGDGMVICRRISSAPRLVPSRRRSSASPVAGVGSNKGQAAERVAIVSKVFQGQIGDPPGPELRPRLLTDAPSADPSSRAGSPGGRSDRSGAGPNKLRHAINPRHRLRRPGTSPWRISSPRPLNRASSRAPAPSRRGPRDGPP